MNELNVLKVVVPSSDEKTVFKHFGKARFFIVFEFEKSKLVSRKTIANEFALHASGDHAAFVSFLKQFDVIVCSNIGFRMVKDLENVGVRVELTDEKSALAAATQAIAVKKIVAARWRKNA